MFDVEKHALHRPMPRLALSAVLVTVAFLLRQPLEQRLGVVLPPFITLYPAVIVVALFFGFWPGLLGTALAVALTDYFVLPPIGQFQIASAGDAIALALFSSMGIFISVVAGQYRRGQRRFAALKTEQAVYKSREMLHAALGSMTDAVFICDAERRILEFNDAFVTFHRFKSKAECARTLGEYPAILDVFMASGEPAPREMWAAPRALRGETASSAEYIIRRKDTGETWVGSYSFGPIREQDGVISGCVVTVRDITESKRQEARLRRFYNTDLFAILYWKIDGGVVDANDQFLKMTGYTREDLRKGLLNWAEITAPEYQAMDEDARRQIRETGVHLPYEKEFIRKDGERTWAFGSSAAYEDDRNEGISFILDITQRKRAQQQLEAVNRTLNALSNSNQALLHATDETEFLNQVCRIVTEDCGHAMVWVGIAEDDEEKTVRPVAWSGLEEEYLQPGKVRWDLSENGRGATGTAIRTGQLTLCRYILTDPLYSAWRDEAIERGYRSALVIPLKEGEKVTAVFSIYSLKRDAFSQREVDLLTELAGDVEFGIQTLRLRAAHAQAEADLRQSEEKYRLLAESITDPFFAMDRDLRITHWNRSIEKFNGVSAEMAMGKTSVEIFGESENQREIDATFRKCLETGQPLQYEAQWEVDGKNHLLDVRVFPYEGGVATIATDITERRQAEDALRVSEAKLQGIINSAMDAVISVNEQQSIVVFNRAAEMIFQCAASEALGATLDRFIPESARSAHGEHIRRFGKQDETDRSMVQPSILTAVRSNGEEFSIEATISQIEANGEKLYTVILRDITARERAEEALRTSERLYRGVGESIDYGVWVCTPDGRNTYASESFLKLVGFTQQQSTDIGWASLIHPDEAAFVKAAWNECVRTEGTWDMEIRYRGVDGQWHPILTRAVPVRDDKGQIIAWAGIHLDISNAKRAEQALLRSEKLASVGRMAATIAHEINNPLAAVTNLLFLTKLLDGLPDSARRYLEIADVELKRVAHITRQSLGFYRESMMPEFTSVTALLESCIDLLNGKIQAKQAIIKKEWEGNWNITAVAGELRQVFSNLLLNSLDAIDQGGVIRLRVSACKSAKNGCRAVRVTVVDNGYGISRTSRQRIFEPFYTTKETLGTGLGLWVAKQIIDNHSGSIRLRSNTSGRYRGTMFSVVLPVEQAAESRHTEQSQGVCGWRAAEQNLL